MAERVENPVAARPYLEDANYFRLGYQLAAQLMNVECTAKGEQKGKRTPISDDILFGESPRGVSPSNLAQARKTARKMEKDADVLLAWYQWRGKAIRHKVFGRLSRPEKRLQRFLLRTVKPCLQLVTAASLRDEEGAEAELIAKSLRAAAKEGKISYRALYNLACFEAGAEAEHERERALEYLKQALQEAPRERRAELAAWARKDPSLATLQQRKELERLLERFAPSPRG
jgi:hypothetical protein